MYTRINKFILQEPFGASLPANESSESSIDIVLWLQLEDVGSADSSIVSVRKKNNMLGVAFGFQLCMFLKVGCSVVHLYDFNRKN